MSWDPLIEEDQLRISAVVHQNYHMPDVFAVVAQIVREHLTRYRIKEQLERDRKLLDRL